MNTQWRNGLAGLLLVVGSWQMLGDLLGIEVLRGIGASTVYAPYPKVFCDVKGLEPFASKFTLLVTDSNGGKREIEIDPELYARMAGPYNRRNVYGAALAYAPRLPEPLWRAVCGYGLKPEGPLRRTFGLAAGETVEIRIATRTAGRKDVWVLKPGTDPVL